MEVCNKLCDVVKLSCIYSFLWCEGLHFSEKAVSLHRVFHSIRFKVNKVGIQWYPIFFVPTSRCPRCVRLERHMCHPVKLFAPKGFLLCRCWWGAWLVSGSCLFFFFLSFLLIFPTRDASPPLEVAFGGSVWCTKLKLKTQALMGATRLASGIKFTRARTAAGRVCHRPGWWQRCSRDRRRGV